ncbi:AfsR/SARP family transcriptional regulator [Nocardiopsis flavescens]|uniref:AfsR/SARP family transcriptional regulator n=1 Tax=Nocardiopsis flavescens TaxID=758803 RepID=UPI0015BA03CD|nr:BTAD domain-containing putative transcriptional regulator [Nocardiopsis flavescens]
MALTVEISVLGDIRTRIDGHTVDLGHLRRQAVFVALLADANHTVPLDRLIDRAWGPHPPPSARTSLYSYISRLRTALATAGNDATLDRRPGGYTLTLSDTALHTADLHRFRHLTTRARNTTDHTALPLLEEALGLWHTNQPLGALDTPWADHLRDTLRLERLHTQLDRNDLLLRHGRHTHILTDLHTLARTHPLDERLIGQLMLALHREGRTAQALDHYDRTRRALADELGTDPGTELQNLHRKILDTDPELSGPAPSAVLSPAKAEPPAVPRPGQLPAPPPLLAGRARELAALDAVWEPGASPLTVVSGLGGIGKTSLALRWAHDHLDRFPDGQLYANLHGFSPSTPATTPESAVHDFLAALGVDKKAVPTSADAQAGLYRSLLAGRRMVIVLDNARDAEQVRPLIPGSPTCVVLVTSRDRLNGLLATDGARSLALGPLTTTEAHRLLTTRIGQARVTAEPQAARALIDGCGHFPLALAVTAARAAGDPHLPLAELATELHQAETRLDALDTGDLHTSLRGVLDTSHRALPPPAARLLNLLGLLPGPSITTPAITALTGHTPHHTRTLLRTLETAHLIRQPVPGRYELHDLVRLHAKEHAHTDLPKDERHHALHALVAHFVHTAAAANHLLAPHEIPSSVAEEEPPPSPSPALRLEDEARALEWFTAERSTLLAVIRLASDLGLHREVWRLCWDAHLYFRRSGHVEDFIGLSRTGLDVASRLGGESAPALQALMQRSLASTLLMAGRPGEEPLRLLTASLAHFEETGDPLNQAHTHQVLLLSALLTGDADASLDHGEKSLELYRGVGDPLRESTALNNLGWVLAHSFGEYGRARDCCREALEGSRAVGYTVGQASTLDSLGSIATLAGHHAEAVEHYRLSLRAYRSLKDAFEEANTLSGLAEAHHALGEPEHARRAWQQALDLYRTQHRTAQVHETQERLRTLT